MGAVGGRASIIRELDVPERNDQEDAFEQERGLMGLRSRHRIGRKRWRFGE